MTAVRSPARDTGRAPDRSRRGPARRSPARPLPQESAGPRLRVVPPPERGWGPLVLFCVVAFLLTVAASVFVQGERIREQERSDQLNADIRRAEEQSRRLGVEVARAESPERILGEARSLGMVEPAPVAAVPAVPLDAQADTPTDGATGDDPATSDTTTGPDDATPAGGEGDG